MCFWEKQGRMNVKKIWEMRDTAYMDQSSVFYQCVNSVIRMMLAGVVFLLLLHSLFSTGFVGRVFLEDGSEQEKTMNIADNPLRHLLIFVVLTVLLILVRNLWQTIKDCDFCRGLFRRGDSIFLCLVLLTLFVGAAYVLMTQFAPGSDPAKVYAIAMQWRQGDFSAFEEDAYLFRYPFQSGIVLFFYFLSFLFGEGNYVAIQLVYVVCLAVIYVLLSKLSAFFWQGKGLQNLVYVCLLLWTPLAFYVTYLYGILPGMMLSLGAVWFALRYLARRCYRYMVLSSLCMGLATVLKMNCLIYLIAIGCFLVYDIFDSLFLSKDSRPKKWAASLAFILLLAGSVVFCNWGNNRLVERIARQELPEGIPMLSWVVMGLQEAPLGPGGYNGYISEVFTDSQYNAIKAEEVSKKDLQKRVKWMTEDLLKNGLPFLGRKTAFQWNDPTFICLDRTRGRNAAVPVPAPLGSLIDGRGSVKLSLLLNDMQTLIWLGVLLYLFLRWNSRNLYELMGAVIFLGGYLFHLFWESSASYTIPYFVMLIPYAVCGMAEWAGFLARRIMHLRGREYGGTWETAGEEAETLVETPRRKKVLCAAAAVMFCLLVTAFIRTNLFDRTIALNDDLQGIDASDQFYHRGAWETKD